MEFIDNLKSGYAAKMAAYETEKSRIKAQIARLEKKLGKLVYPHWTDLLVRPIMEEVARRTPEIVWEKREQLLTFGMRFECPVFGKTTEGYVVGITFTPGKEIPFYDTGEKCHAWNGFNNVSKPVESIDELVLLVRKKAHSEHN